MKMPLFEVVHCDPDELIIYWGSQNTEIRNINCLFFLAVLLSNIAGTAKQTKVWCRTCVMVQSGESVYVLQKLYVYPRNLVSLGKEETIPSKFIICLISGSLDKNYSRNIDGACPFQTFMRYLGIPGFLFKNVLLGSHFVFQGECC